MKFVRYTRSFDYTDPDTGARTRFPAGWAGEVSAVIAKAATAAQALAVDPNAAPEDEEAPVNPGVTPAPSATGAAVSGPSTDTTKAKGK